MSFSPGITVGDYVSFYERKEDIYSKPTFSWYTLQYNNSPYRTEPGTGKVVELTTLPDGKRKIRIEVIMNTRGGEYRQGDLWEIVETKGVKIVQKLVRTKMLQEQLMRGSFPIVSTKLGAAAFPAEVTGKILGYVGTNIPVIAPSRFGVGLPSITVPTQEADLYKKYINGKLNPRQVPVITPSSSCASCTISRKSSRRRSNKTRRTQRTKQNRY